MMLMFRCERHRMTLSTASCAKLWEAAQRQRLNPWESHAACRTCSIGAANAGRPLPVPAAEELRMTCNRCRRRAARLIRGRLCISCYNREQEALKGRNAKGGRPRLCDILHVEHVAVIEGAVVRQVLHENVVSPVEVMIALAKRAKAPIAFGVRGVRLAPVECGAAA
jgi:hypothetical protein